MSLLDILSHRRSVRDYLPTPIDGAVVRKCLELATLAPTSSNMQLYQAYHIIDKSMLAQLSVACLSQGAACSAQQMVVFVVRPDLCNRRAKAVFAFEKQNIKTYSPAEKVVARTQKAKQYYHWLMPMLYSQNVPVSLARYVLTKGVQRFRPMWGNASNADMRVVLHKSCGLVAQTFMLAMSEQGLDTCPMEGFDEGRIKKLLKLPKSSEINMVVSCGVRSKTGVWGERYRVPFTEVYHKI